MQATIVSILQTPDYPQEILRGAALLNAGKLVVLPTETVYGVAGILTDESVRRAIQNLRRSPDPKPTTIHLARREDALQYLGDVGDFGQRLMKKLWPGPVGLTFDVPEQRRREVARKLGVPENEIYQGSKITLRCPDHPVFLDIVSRVPQPVILTSVGAGRQRAEVEDDVLGQVEMVFDAGETRFSKPSTLLAVNGPRYEIVRAGVYDGRIIERLLKTTILFICSGNTCRSPMAEAIARQILAEELKVSPDELENKGISVISAGSYALPGSRAAEPAVDVLKEMGMDLSRHRSRALSVELIHQADLIFAMTRGHASAVTSLVPSAADKVFTLDPQKDIEDPIGGDAELYKQVATQIRELIQRRLVEQAII